MSDVFDAMFDMLMEHKARHGPGIEREYRAAPDAYDAIQAAARERWPKFGRGERGEILRFQDVPIVYDLRLDAGIIYVRSEQRIAGVYITSGTLAGIYLGEIIGTVHLDPPKLL